MENTVNEGQTQVYMDGGIDPQAGVNTDAPYLNNPPSQLHNSCIVQPEWKND